eukprot:gene18417-5903_t
MAELEVLEELGDDTVDLPPEWSEQALEALHKYGKGVDGIPRQVGRAWFDAARSGDLSTIRKLLKHNKNFIHFNGKGCTYGFMGSTALHWACANAASRMDYSWTVYVGDGRDSPECFRVG